MKFFKRQVTYIGLLKTSVILLLLCTLVSVTGGVLLLELMSHFQLYYFISALVLSVLLLIGKQYRFLIVAVLAVTLSGVQLIPFYFDAAETNTKQNGQPVSILLSNVLTSNQDFPALFEYIAKVSPDIVVLQEIDSLWAEHLRSLAADYPFQLIEPRNDNFGIALLSRIAPKQATTISLGSAGLPSIWAEFSMPSVNFTLLATHPLPPINTQYYQYRNEQLQAAAEHLSMQRGPKILVGDLNITPFSSEYRDLESSTGLTNTRYGFGYLATWPAGLPVLQIPIDHVLVSDEINVVNVNVGPDIGSDHLPILAKLVF